MPAEIRRPSSLDVSVKNPNSTIYIIGDNDTDGSIRFEFTTGDSNAHIESRASGVWNDTGIRVASSSLQLGLNTTLSSISSYLETIDLSALGGHNISFIPHTEFSHETGTTFTHAPAIDVEETFVVFSTAVSEITGTTIGINLGVTPSRIVQESIHEVGTTGASAEVVVRFYKGTDNTGDLFDQKTLPSSDLVADTTLTIDYGQDLGFEGGQNIFQEFTSTASFSLKTDSEGNPLTSHVGHEITELGVVTENLALSNNLDLTYSNDLELTYANQF